MERLINIVELATTLADIEVTREFKDKYGESTWENHVFEPDEENFMTKFTREAQPVFDKYYDKFMSIIKECEV